ncbi:MAG: hypothetical protein NVS3B2_18090 [Ramlibacter sp.]
MPAQKLTGDLSAIAFRVAAVLEAYQQQLDTLASDWLNRPLYRKATAQLEELRSLLGALPQLAVDLVEVVVCHAKLLHLLQAQATGGDLSQLQLRQTDAVVALRRKTLRLICESSAA